MNPRVNGVREDKQDDEIKQKHDEIVDQLEQIHEKDEQQMEQKENDVLLLKSIENRHKEQEMY